MRTFLLLSAASVLLLHLHMLLDASLRWQRSTTLLSVSGGPEGYGRLSVHNRAHGVRNSHGLTGTALQGPFDNVESWLQRTPQRFTESEQNEQRARQELSRLNVIYEQANGAATSLGDRGLPHLSQTVLTTMAEVLGGSGNNTLPPVDTIFILAASESLEEQICSVLLGSVLTLVTEKSAIVFWDGAVPHEHLFDMGAPGKQPVHVVNVRDASIVLDAELTATARGTWYHETLGRPEWLEKQKHKYAGDVDGGRVHARESTLLSSLAKVMQELSPTEPPEILLQPRDLHCEVLVRVIQTQEQTGGLANDMIMRKLLSSAWEMMRPSHRVAKLELDLLACMGGTARTLVVVSDVLMNRRTLMQDFLDTFSRSLNGKLSQTTERTTLVSSNWILLRIPPHDEPPSLVDLNEILSPDLRQESEVPLEALVQRPLAAKNHGHETLMNIFRMKLVSLLLVRQAHPGLVFTSKDLETSVDRLSFIVSWTVFGQSAVASYEHNLIDASGRNTASFERLSKALAHIQQQSPVFTISACNDSDWGYQGAHSKRDALGRLNASKPAAGMRGMKGSSLGRHRVSLLVATMDRNFTEALLSWYTVHDIYEIVVVDWGSQPPVALESLPQPPGNIKVHLVRANRQEKWILSQAYNFGAQAVTGDIIVKVDAETRLHPDFVRSHKMQYGSFFRGMWWLTDESQGHNNGLCMLWAADFQLVRGYDERIQNYGMDDTDLYARLVAKGLHGRPIDMRFVQHIDHDDASRVRHSLESLPRLSLMRMTKLLDQNRQDIRKYVKLWDVAVERATSWSCESATGSKPHGGHGYSALAQVCNAVPHSHPPSLLRLVPRNIVESIELGATRWALRYYSERILSHSTISKAWNLHNLNTLARMYFRIFLARMDSNSQEARVLAFENKGRTVPERLLLFASARVLASHLGRMLLMSWSGSPAFTDLFNVSGDRSLYTVALKHHDWFPKHSSGVRLAAGSM